MPYLCKTCAQPVELKEKTAFCANCNKELEPNETIGSWTLDARVTQLEAMHTLMCEANDEALYMTWINLMPDGATKEDFIDIALDDDLYNECFDLFVKLIKKEGNRY